MLTPIFVSVYVSLGAVSIEPQSVNDSDSQIVPHEHVAPPVAQQAAPPLSAPSLGAPLRDSSQIDVVTSPKDVITRKSYWQRSPGGSKRIISLGRDKACGAAKTQTWIAGSSYGAGVGASLFTGVLQLKPEVSLPLSILTLSGGLAAAYALTHQTPRLNAGILSGTNFGYLFGTYDAKLITLLITRNTHLSDKAEGRLDGSISLIASTAGGVAGGFLAKRLHATAGDLAIMGTTTFWGNLTGLSLALLIKNHFGDSAMTSALLIGSVAETAVGAAIAANFDISRDRSWLLDLGAVGGIAS